MQGIDDAIRDRLRLMLSRNLSVQEEERRRIARDLHDHLGQQLTALHLQLDALHRVADHRGGELSDQIGAVQTLALQIDRDLHFLTSQLRSSVLEHIGLVAALTDFVEAFAATHEMTISLDVLGFGAERLVAESEVHLYRVAQEALNNARKHAQAQRLEVMLQQHRGRVVLSISDDGIGFDAEALMADAHDAGLGLLGMRERAGLIGGTLQIESTPGHGTTVIVSTPAVFREPRWQPLGD
jgi:signal transduction histidine kinase